MVSGWIWVQEDTYKTWPERERERVRETDRSKDEINNNEECCRGWIWRGASKGNVYTNQPRKRRS